MTSLKIDPTEAEIILSVLRRGQRSYGKGTAGYEVCKTVADRLEQKIVLRGTNHRKEKTDE